MGYHAYICLREWLISFNSMRYHICWTLTLLVLGLWQKWARWFYWSISFHKYFLICHLLTFWRLFLGLRLLRLLDSIPSSTIAPTSKVTPKKLCLLQVHIELSRFLRVVQDWVHQAVIPHVAEVILIPRLLVFLSYLLLLELIRSFLSHLPAIEVVWLLFLEPIKMD